MSVKVSCRDDHDLLSVELNVNKGEVLIYEVSFQGAQAVFAVTDQHGTILLSPKDMPVATGHYRRTWPMTPSEVKVPDDLNHVLAVHFIAATKYSYVVTRRDKDRNVLETCKDCDYGSTTPTDSFFDPLRVFTF